MKLPLHGAITNMQPKAKAAMEELPMAGVTTTMPKSDSTTTTVPPGVWVAKEQPSKAKAPTIDPSTRQGAVARPLQPITAGGCMMNVGSTAATRFGGNRSVQILPATRPSDLKRPSCFWITVTIFSTHHHLHVCPSLGCVFAKTARSSQTNKSPTTCHFRPNSLITVLHSASPACSFASPCSRVTFLL